MFLTAYTNIADLVTSGRNGKKEKKHEYLKLLGNKGRL